MSLFKKCLLLLLLVLLFLGASDVVRAADSARTVRVGGYNNSPKIYKDNNDQPAGVYADILDYIAKKENWKLEYVWGTWEAGLARLKSGEIDIMPDVAISPEREKQFDFSKETVLNSWAVIYVQKDSSISSILDLKGKKISILKSSIYRGGQEGIDAYLRAFGINATIVEVDNYRQALDFLSLGKVDAAVVSYISGLTNQKDYPNLKATKIFLEPTELRFALTKGDSDNAYLIEKLDYWVDKLKKGQDNYFHKTLEKYGLSSIESEVPPQAFSPKEAVPSWFVKIALGVLVVAPWLMLIIISKRTGKSIMGLLRGKI